MRSEVWSEFDRLELFERTLQSSGAEPTAVAPHPETMQPVHKGPWLPHAWPSGQMTDGFSDAPSMCYVVRTLCGYPPPQVWSILNFGHFGAVSRTCKKSPTAKNMVMPQPQGHQLHKVWRMFSVRKCDQVMPLKEPTDTASADMISTFCAVVFQQACFICMIRSIGSDVSVRLCFPPSNSSDASSRSYQLRQIRHNRVQFYLLQISHTRLQRSRWRTRIADSTVRNTEGDVVSGGVLDYEDFSVCGIGIVDVTLALSPGAALSLPRFWSLGRLKVQSWAFTCLGLSRFRGLGRQKRTGGTGGGLPDFREGRRERGSSPISRILETRISKRNKS